MSRIMFASPSSGSGKTTIVCAILKALKNKKLNIKAFKCGPDYIDGMYHRVIDVPSSNIDSFFCSRDELCTLLDFEGCSVIEGAMGFYDGLSFTEKASAYEISQLTDTPVVLIISSKGMANSLGALLKGFLEYKPNHIKGVIFNGISRGVYNKMADIALNMGLIPLGYFPYNKELAFESRHLGLVQPDAIENKINLLAAQAEKYIDLQGIINIMNTSPKLIYNKISINKKYNKTIAVAYDEAFSFLYEDNINIIKSYGCNVVFFSPLRDKTLPKCDRLIISGGYPELYAKELSENTQLMADIRYKINNGLKTIAECGGFMYLHKRLQADNGEYYNMAGVIDGECYKTHRLQSFGYYNMKALNDNLLCQKNDSIKIHEFHYWQSTAKGDDFILTKPNSDNSHSSAYGKGSLYAGFPHIYFWGNRKALERFLND